jgi:hypothetical protein
VNLEQTSEVKVGHLIKGVRIKFKEVTRAYRDLAITLEGCVKLTVEFDRTLRLAFKRAYGYARYTRRYRRVAERRTRG